jgi:hypothetical protein
VERRFQERGPNPQSAQPSRGRMLRSLNIPIHGTKTRERRAEARNFKGRGLLSRGRLTQFFGLLLSVQRRRPGQDSIDRSEETTGSISHDEGAAERASIKSQSQAPVESWCQLIPSSGGWTLHRQASRRSVNSSLDIGYLSA